MYSRKRSFNKNYKRQVPLSKQKISINQGNADLKKKGHDGGGL
jgi:hypothetical protein